MASNPPDLNITNPGVIFELKLKLLSDRHIDWLTKWRPLVFKYSFYCSSPYHVSWIGNWLVRKSFV